MCIRDSLQVANMQSFFKEHSAGFHTAEAKSIWKEYTESYYQMDTYYLSLIHIQMCIRDRSQPLLKIAICDDEKVFRDVYKRQLKLNILLNTSLNGLAMNEINLGNIASIKERAGIHSGICLLYTSRCV